MSKVTFKDTYLGIEHFVEREVIDGKEVVCCYLTIPSYEENEGIVNDLVRFNSGIFNHAEINGNEDTITLGFNSRVFNPRVFSETHVVNSQEFCVKTLQRFIREYCALKNEKAGKE